MGQNSILSNLSKEDIIAEIRLTLATDFEHKKAVVIVEGEDDIQFFNGKLHEDVDLRESFSGKLGVVEIVNHFSDDRVIGICDKDYDLQSTCRQLFYYDFSCLEMMLIANDSAFFPVVYTYYRGSKMPYEIRLQLLANLKWLSLYRKLSVDNNWAVRFNGLSISKAYDSTMQTIDIGNLLQQINTNNPGLISRNREQLELLSTTCREEYDLGGYLLITQGHDFMYCFQAFCKSERKLKGKSPGAEELFHALLCSYRKEDFTETALYQSLVSHQATYGVRILAS